MSAPAGPSTMADSQISANAGPRRPVKRRAHRARPARSAPLFHALTSVAEVNAAVVPAATWTRDDIAALQRVIAAPTKAEGDR